MVRALLCLLLLVSTAHAGGKKYDYADFWNVAGVTHDDTPETTLKKWGDKGKLVTAGKSRSIDYGPGLDIEWREDGGIQITMSELAATWIAAHPSPTASLIALTCKDAGARLAFWKKAIPRYLTCKRYDRTNWLLDVTVMCSKKVSMVAIVWFPLPADQMTEAAYGAHCDAS